jgi:membrane-bound lytic murein transglycosylase D
MKEIPENGRKHYLFLPVEKVGLFISNEELVYERSSSPQPQYTLPSEPVLASSAQSATPSGTPKVVYEEEWKSHKVRRGESLGGIADKYGVSLAQLKKWNKIKGSVIHPGQKLKVQHKTRKVVYRQEEQTAAQKPQEAAPAVSEESATAQTGEQQVEAEEKRVSSPPRYKYYTIQRGDTLYKIAARHEGVTVDDIKTLNSGLREHKLVVGQKIKLKQIG